MKTRIESDGKTHQVYLVSENEFEKSIIDAINCYNTKATISKTASKPGDNVAIEFIDTLVIKMENRNE